MSMSETEDVSSPPAQPEIPGSAAPIAPAVPVQPRRSGRRRFLGFLTIAILVLLAGGIALTVQYFRTSNASVTALTREIAMLKNEAGALNTRVAALENSSSEARAASAQIADLTMRLGALESQIAQTADRDTLAQLQGRIARLENASPGEMFKLAAATLARANLVRAVESGSSFVAPLDAVRATAPDDPALVSLQPMAESGVPSLRTLAVRFPDAARQSLDAELQTASGGMARFWASVRRLISIRRIGDAAGTATADRLARAQTDLDRGDLADAVVEVRRLSGTAALPVQSWLRDANARLEADRAVADLNTQIVQTLAAPELAAPSEIAPAARQTSPASRQPSR
jgi:hypothetical protein